MRPLAQAGYRVVAVDQRGCGDSQTHGPYDVPTLANDVAHLIEALGQNDTYALSAMIGAARLVGLWPRFGLIWWGVSWWPIARTQGGSLKFSS
jgi:pimeloyl-ACP methyl ester carboxylesterase